MVLLGVCDPNLETLALFRTKMCDFQKSKVKNAHLKASVKNTSYIRPNGQNLCPFSDQLRNHTFWGRTNLLTPCRKYSHSEYRRAGVYLAVYHSKALRNYYIAHKLHTRGSPPPRVDHKINNSKT